MRRRISLLTIAALIASAIVATPLGAQTDGDTRERGQRMGAVVSPDFELRHPDEEVQVFIQLDRPSVAEFAASTGAGRAAQRAQALAVKAQQREVMAEIGELVIEERSRLVVGANGIRAVVRAGDIPLIRSAEGVESVATVTRYHLLNETSVPWIRAHDEADDLELTGEGTSIAIIDTGIDYTHAALGGSGDPADYADNDPTELVSEDGFPNDKVVGGYDFAGSYYDAADPDLAPKPDDDPLDVDGHGTHVAATAAGLATGTVGQGVAPGAELYALKVFGDVAGSTDLVADAIEWALDPNGDGSIEDAVDVINMSLGSDYGHPNDPSSIAAQNAVDLGVIVVAAAGNAGPLPYVTGSPAVADGVISVAASLDGGAEVMAMTIDEPESIRGEYEAAGSEFGSLDPPTQGELALAAPSDACNPLTNDVTGKIALVDRGTCEFTEKVRNAEQAGAIGVLVVNNVEGPPITMAHNGAEPRPHIPAMMVRQETGELIRRTHSAESPVTVTLRGDLTTSLEGLADTMADFSSQGPGFGNAFEPDVSAPGFNIRSADVGTGDGAALSSGTSMATPHVAGAAALLREWRGDLTPEAAKALLMNAANPASDADGVVPISRQGTGTVQIDRIVENLSAYTTPGGVVMRVNALEPTTQTAAIEVTGLSGDLTYQAEIEKNQTLDGVDWSVSSTTVDTGESLDVTLTVDPAALAPDDGFLSQREADAWLVLSNPEDPEDRLRVGLIAVVDPASTVAAAGGEQEVALTNDGPSLGFADGFTAAGDGIGSLAQVGYRTSDAERESGGTRTIEFGLALSQPWSAPSETEVNVFIDVDQDGSDDFVLVAADLGLLTGAPEPTGNVVTALIDLASGGGVILYDAVTDMNDQVMIVPADLTGTFGFLGDDGTAFDMTVMVFDQLGPSGISDVITVDLEAEVTAPDGLSQVLDGGESVTVPTDRGGDMLWLFPNNPVGQQHAVADLTASTEPPGDGDDDPPSDEAEPPSFDDVPEDHLFHGEIVWLATQGITRGCNPPQNTRFCPEESVTRGQMAAFLHRTLDLGSTDENFFVDDEKVIFQDEINRLAAAGITKGCNPPTNDDYCPDEKLTRAQMATFLVRSFGLAAGAGSDRFVDDDGNIHEDAIDALAASDITRGCNPPTNDRFCPDQPITRGQMAAFIYRMAQLPGDD